MNPVLALIITNIIWGAASPIFKFALYNIPPFTLGCIRFFGASLLLLPFAIRNWKKISLADFFLILLGAVFSINVNIGFFFLGLQKTESINAPIIASSQPIFIYAFSILFLKEKVNKKILKGLLIALFGVAIIIISPLLSDGGISLGVKEGAIEGNLFLVIATLGAVVNALIFKEVLKRVNMWQVTFISFVFGALVFIPVMLPELAVWSFSDININGWVGIFYGVIFSSALAYGLFNYGISKIPAQEIGIFAYIDPIVSVAVAIPLVHEYPTIAFYVGTLFVFLGILYAEGRIQYHPFYKIIKKRILNL